MECGINLATLPPDIIRVIVRIVTDKEDMRLVSLPKAIAYLVIYFA